MAGDPVNEYLEAKGKRDKLDIEIEDMARQLLSAGERLSAGGWRRTTVAGSGGFEYPAAMRMPDIREWPTAGVIRVKMQEWHKLDLATLNAWNGVPPEKRGGLKPPDER
jgi:hypothetical protein